MKSKLIFLHLVLGALLLSGCAKEDTQQLSELEQTGILGKWEIQGRITDQISDLKAYCCEFIVFVEDNQPTDNRGEFNSYGTGYETDGTFEINLTGDTVSFNFNDKYLKYRFEVQDTILTFSYEDDGHDVSEDWIKRE
jgi:hypothetical protein